MTTIKLYPEYKLRFNLKRPPASMIERYRDFPAATISDALGKRNALPCNIKPVYKPFHKIVGPAFTIAVSPGDELLALKAIEVAKPGDVIIAAGAGPARCSLWGGIMSTMAKVRGIAGLVTDGLVRDVEQSREVEFPIFAAGVTPIAPAIDVPPGSMNYPVSFGEVVVHPGDLVVGDDDGVVIVPVSELETVAESVTLRLQREVKWVEEILATKKMILSEKVNNLLEARVVAIEK